jgi:hypothetical protein
MRMMNEKIAQGTLERVQNARHRISEQFNHEPEKLIRYYMELQEKEREKRPRSIRHDPGETVGAGLSGGL